MSESRRPRTDRQRGGIALEVEQRGGGALLIAEDIPLPSHACHPTVVEFYVERVLIHSPPDVDIVVAHVEFRLSLRRRDQQAGGAYRHGRRQRDRFGTRERMRIVEAELTKRK